jgi:hypothetical protein
MIMSVFRLYFSFLSNTNATGIICHVAQMNGTEVNHEGRILRAVMENGDLLMLSDR